MDEAWEHILNEFEAPLSRGSTISRAFGRSKRAQYISRHTEEREPHQVQVRFTYAMSWFLEGEIVLDQHWPERVHGLVAVAQFVKRSASIFVHESRGAMGDFARSDAFVLAAHAEVGDGSLDRGGQRVHRVYRGFSRVGEVKAQSMCSK